VTADELIAKAHELALTPREGDADLDAMSPEEAAARGLFCAWVDRRDRRRAEVRAAALAEAHAQVAEMAAEMILEHQRKL
jgi:hypothetical protein